MKAAELAGLDATEVTQTAVRSRSLNGTRDVASVLDARMRAMVEPLVPLPLSPWSERVPEIADPERQEYVRRLAEAMDERAGRIGEHAVRRSRTGRCAPSARLPGIQAIGWTGSSGRP